MDDEDADLSDKKEIARRMDIILERMDDTLVGPFTSFEISDRCGCSRQSIENIYNKAMGKLREQFNENK